MPSGHRVNEAEVSLREWLETNAPKRGTRLPSERALALQLGLRHYALNRAMSRLISEGLVERTGYKLFVAGGTPSTTTLTCHLVVALRSIHIPGYRRIAKEMGIKLVLHTWESIDEVILKLEKLDSRDTQAVVFDPPYAAPASLWEPMAARLHKHGIPIVCISPLCSNLFSVSADSHQSMELAIQHLTDLGHHEFGLVTAPPIGPMSAEILQIWDELCRKFGLKQSTRRIHLQKGLRLKEEADEVADVVINQWSAITALIFVAMPDCNIQLLEERLIQKGRSIPKSLSLLLVGESKSAATSTPPIATVNVDMPVLQETAFFLAQRAARKKKQMGILLPPCGVRIQPQLAPRQSTGPADTAGSPIKKAPRVPIPARETAQLALKPSAEIHAELDAHLRKAYPLAARAFLSERTRFASVDLGPLVNRPLNFRRGWLGDLPLKRLSPGSHEIHGVPFQILGGPKRSDCGSIVFHSAVNTTGNSQKLPDKLKIPIGSKAEAVYILHGCGYAKFNHTFAHYDFHARSNRIDRIPLTSLGQPPSHYDIGQPDHKTDAPNIQDWWPDFPHTDFPHARMAPILDADNASHESRHVYLYTLEWINPSPQSFVSHLEITVDPDHATTLGVLAVTVLKP
jgi:DNA-binding LacI/PurR family transcriptional regulator